MHAHHYFRQLDGQITMEGMKAKAATTALILGLLLSASAMMIAEAAAAEPAAGGTRFCNCLCECVPHCKLAKVCIFKCVVTCSLKTKLVEDVPLRGNNSTSQECGRAPAGQQLHFSGMRIAWR